MFVPKLANFEFLKSLFSHQYLSLQLSLWNLKLLIGYLLLSLLLLMLIECNFLWSMQLVVVMLSALNQLSGFRKSGVM